MPRIADYAIITDGKFSIQTSGDIDKDFSFTLESGANLGSRSILAFVLFVEAGAGSIGFKVSINGSSELQYTFTEARVNTLHEVISANLLKAGTNANKIVFSITGGSGKLDFGDIVLHYQRDI